MSESIAKLPVVEIVAWVQRVGKEMPLGDLLLDFLPKA